MKILMSSGDKNLIQNIEGWSFAWYALDQVTKPRDVENFGVRAQGWVYLCGGFETKEQAIQHGIKERWIAL